MNAAPPLGEHSVLLKVDGMHCVNCVRKLERTLAAAGATADINLVGGTAELRWRDAQRRVQQFVELIAEAGFTAQPLQQVEADQPTDTPEPAGSASLLRIGIAGILGMQVMMLAATAYFVAPGDIPLPLQQLIRQAQWWLATPVLLYAGWPFLAGAWTALHMRTLTMDVTVSAALLLAYLASAVATMGGSGQVYFDSVTMFVFLLLLARHFEERGRAAATRRLHELAAAQPRDAQREQADGRLATVPIAQLASGEVVVVPPGIAVPADGELLDSAAECDEALLTGESRPVMHCAGDSLCAGAINVGRAPLRLRLTRVGADSTLSQLTRLVHRAQSQRPRTLRLADRIAGQVLAAVLLLSVAGAALWWQAGPDHALAVALAVLAVTCPCALSLATPTALAAAASGLARRGILVVDADALLRLARVDRVCLDKTGTLTDGRMSIVELVRCSSVEASEALALGAALERGVHHPLALAFAPYDDGRPVSDVRVLPGRGPQGRVGNACLQLASSEGEGELSWLTLSRDGEALARFGLAQNLRPDAASAVALLKQQGLQPSLLSGDSAAAVSPLAARLGIRRWHARQSPADKLERLRELHAAGHRVWMVGDGLNDAPVLAGADVSTSLASASALSQARADLLLLNDRLDGLGLLLRQARRCRAVVVQNLLWAALYNLIAVPLALAGLVTPWVASLGMGISSLVVVANALRLALPPVQGPRSDLEETLA